MFEAFPKTPYKPSTHDHDDGRVPGKVRRFSDLGNWLSHPDKSVTRAEVWELLNRYEAGRAANEARRFAEYCDRVLAARRLDRRLGVWVRAMWARLRGRAVPVAETQLPTAPLESL